MKSRSKRKLRRLKRARAKADSGKTPLSTTAKKFRKFLYTILTILAILGFLNLEIDAAFFVFGLLFLVFISNYIRTRKLTKLRFDLNYLYVIKNRKRINKIPLARVVRLDETLKRISDVDNIWFVEYEDPTGELFQLEFLPKNLVKFIKNVKLKNPEVRLPSKYL